VAHAEGRGSAAGRVEQRGPIGDLRGGEGAAMASGSRVEEGRGPVSTLLH